MRWFKHMSNMLDDPWIQDVLIPEWGMEGFGLWCALLEVYASHFDGTEEGLEVEILNSTLERKLHKRSKQVQEFLNFCSTSGKLLSEKVEKLHIIQIPKMLELRDEWASRKKVNSGVTREQLPQQNTEDRSKKINTPLPPQGESMFFAQFWAEYPKKVTKKESAAYWQQNKLDRRFTEILNGLHAWKMTDQWQKDGGKYIPDAIRFLRKERWLDEAPALPKPANGEKPKSFKQRIMEAKRIRNKYDGTVVEMSDLRIENDQICDLHGQLFPYQDYEPIEETL